MRKRWSRATIKLWTAQLLGSQLNYIQPTRTWWRSC